MERQKEESADGSAGFLDYDRNDRIGYYIEVEKCKKFSS